jgi:predicted dehydrogenase
MDPNLKIAVAGAGAWGKNIVATLHKLDRLGPVAESSPGLRDALAKQIPGIELREDYRDLVGDKLVPAVAVATPAPTHHEIARAFLGAGQDLFLEKPMTLTTSEAEDLVALAEQKGRVLMTGHLLMYQPAIRFLRDYLQEDRLGAVRTLHQERAKLGRARSVENALWSLGVHDIAVLLFLTGAVPCEVQAFGHDGLQPGIADDVYLHLRFPSGVKASLHNSWLWPEDSRVLRIIGERGMLEYREREQKVWLHRKGIDPNLHNVDEGSELLFEGNAEPLTLELEHFVECVATRSKPLSDGVNGLEVIRVLEQAGALL